MKPRDFLVIPAAALGVMVLNVLISVIVVWIYSTFVNPGQPYARYQDFAVQAAPISSVLAGIPLMFLAGFILARRRSRRDALAAAGAVAILYIVVDGAMMAASGAGASVWTWEALSYSTKLLAALAGAWVGSGRKVRPS